MNRRRLFAIASVVLAVTSLVPRATVAQAPVTRTPTEADVLAELVDGDLERAAALAQRAWEETHAPWAALRVAQTDAARGRWVDADAALAQVVSSPTVDATEVEGLRETIAAHIVRLTIDVEPREATVRVNGVLRPVGVATTVERDVPAIIVAQMAGYETTTLRFSPSNAVERRTIRLVEDTVETTSDSGAVGGSGTEPATRASPVTWALLGASVAMGGASIGTGLHERATYRELENGCGRVGCTSAEIDDSGVLASARATTSLLVLGGTTAVASLLVGVLVRRESDAAAPSINAWVSPHGIGVAGRF